MKIKAACIGTPKEVVDAFSSNPFVSTVLLRVVEKELGVMNVLSRPAEYYVQKADTGPAPKEGVMGVEVRLSGVSRNGRTPKQFHNALSELVHIVKFTIEQIIDCDDKCQIFCVIMIDGEVEVKPNSGVYSFNLESMPEQVRGLKKQTTE